MKAQAPVFAPSSWTIARLARAQSMWKDGRTASEIAAALGGVSRSAVLGKLRRLGLLGTREPQKAHFKPRPRLTVIQGGKAEKRRATPRSTKKRFFSVASLPAVGEQASLGIRIGDIGEHACRWIAGDPRSGGTCCGHPAVGTLSYCGHHARRAYRTEAR
jgi:GcrA cell cycle regulator